MSDLSDLYQQVIIDHSKKPRNFRKIENADVVKEGYNPLCGDKLMLYIKMDGGVVTDISFEGSGCAISTASASMLTDELKGKTRKEIILLFEKFHKLVIGEGLDDGEPDLGKLEVFEGVSQFPTRVKCASLCWHTLKAALEHKEGRVSTE